MSAEDLIQVTISPVHLRAGMAENIDVRLTNVGPGRCTNIIFSVRLPVGLVLLKGTVKIQQNTLAAGESFNTRLRVTSDEPGPYRLTSPSFSYQDHQGRSRHVKDFAANITVGEGKRTALRPRLSAELVTEEVGLGEWGLLRASATNVGDADAFEVVVTLAGQSIATEENRPIAVPVLALGSSEDLTFHVLARESGTHVPIRLDFSYRGPDGQPYKTEKRYSLRVGRDRTELRKAMKILFLGASPPSLQKLRIDEEIREIRQEIRLGRGRDRIQIETQLAVRPPDISRALLDVEPDLVHFAGHGGGGEESFVAEDQSGDPVLVPVAGLVKLFGVVGKNVSCVLVNACSTQQLAMELSATLPEAYVIGMREPVGDGSAISFSVGFYQAMAADRSVEEAFGLGKAQMLMAYGRASAPVLWRGGVVITE